MPDPAVPRLPATGEPLVELLHLMRRLRAECPWKREQTHRSLARYLVEELHETLEAIDTGDREHLREELGDLLLQVCFHAAVAEEAGDFTLDDVARGLIEKLVRRNPHVFAPDAASPTGAAAVNDAWQQIKATEKDRTHLADGIPPTLPALLVAAKVLDRRERAGLPVPAPAPGDGDIGEQLLALVARANASGTDPEQALRDAVRRLPDPPRPV